MYTIKQALFYLHINLRASESNVAPCVGLGRRQSRVYRGGFTSSSTAQAVHLVRLRDVGQMAVRGDGVVASGGLAFDHHLLLGGGLVVEVLRCVHVVWQGVLMPCRRALQIRRAQNVVHHVHRAVVLHREQISVDGHATCLGRVRAVVVQLGEQVRAVVVVEVHYVFAAHKWVRVGYVQWVDKDERASAEGLPQTEVSLPVGGVHGHDDARVEHLLEVGQADLFAGRRTQLKVRNIY
jgi:hypothetical protein